MPYAMDDTIAAIASPGGGAVRGVIRLSGPATVTCLRSCYAVGDGRRLDDVRRPTRLTGYLRLGPPIQRLACQLYLWPTRRSFTRQPAAELHLLGSPPLLDASLACVCRHGARLALPGEFTLRAFLAGRIDLTQAEAVLGVIEAASDTELHTALAQLAGGLSGPLQALRGELLDLLATIEAGLDFVDEDIEFITADEIDRRVGHALASINDMLVRLTTRGETAVEPWVVLRGAPNVGKSSLLNALVGTEAALVSPQAGTTRDYVAHRFRWHGVAGTLVDTAGLGGDLPPDPVVQAAQHVTNQRTQHAALELLCLDASQPRCAADLHLLAQSPRAERLIVGTKSDLARPGATSVPGLIATSSVTGQGLAELRQVIAERLADQPCTGAVAATAVRCRTCLESAVERLQRARQVLAQNGGEELVAAELRDALDQLSIVVGAVYTDDLLDRIFSRFCIGK